MSRRLKKLFAVLCIPFHRCRLCSRRMGVLGFQYATNHGFVHFDATLVKVLGNE